MYKLILAVLTATMAFTNAMAQSHDPDLRTLSQAGFIMGPGNSSFAIHESWQKYTRVMKFANTFDAIVQEIDRVVCGADQNKSVLIVGEPDTFYRYIFARIAQRADSPCNGLWHVEVDINKIESGHKYVGEVDEYWRQYILTPSENKDVVLYLNSLGALIGLGSHSNDSTGIEQEYSSDVSSGRIRSVAFMDKYDYNETIRSRNAYVLESFATKIVLPPVTSDQAAELVQLYLATLYPNVKLGAKQLNYLTKISSYYMPNRSEPERSLAIINKIIREGSSAKKVISEKIVNIETEHPYPVNTKQNWTIEYPEASEIQLIFEMFDVERNYDKLTVRDEQGTTLGVLTGNLGAVRTDFFPTNKLLLEFVADGSGAANQGFKISKVITATYKEHIIQLAELRDAIMELAQVPRWLIDKDYSVIRNLKAMLDEDVIGVTEGKEDLVRLAKNGYVAGRTDDKPIGTVMFAGPTGTGKSYIAKKMAEFTGQKLITIDMTSYKEVSSFKTFQEVMARNLTNSPYAVYLFEEIDKAAVEVLDQLYFMMDEGIFYDQYQRPLFARGAFLILTTNAASDTILSNPKAPDLRKLVMQDLQRNFRMSFLNRFDAITIFLPFSTEEYHQLARTLTNKKIRLLKEYYDWTVTVDNGVYDYIANHGQSAIFGARPMERLVEGVLGSGIAEYQLDKSVVPDFAKMDFTKLQAEHAFRLKVNNSSIDYLVNPGNNSGHLESFRALEAKGLKLDLQKLFEVNRIYND